MARQKEKEIKVDPKIKALDETVKNLKKRFGDGSIMKLGEIQTSMSNFNRFAVSGYGVRSWRHPQGRVIEIYGPESSGKTTLALHIIAEAQKRGGMASTNAAIPPLFWASATICKAIVVLPDDSGP